MSALCQKQTLAASFDHLISDGKERRCRAPPLCLENDQLEFDPPYYRRVKLERFGLLTYQGESRAGANCGAHEVIASCRADTAAAKSPAENTLSGRNK